LVARASE
jgi:hypothetical protein